MEKALAAACALIGAAALSSPALAQERKLSADLSLGVTHDSNFARSSAAQAAIRGIKPEETLYTPSLNLNYSLPIGRQTAFLTGGIGYVFHKENPRLDRERVNLDGGVRGRIGPCGGALTGGYARAQSDLEDVTFGPVVNVVTRQSVQLNLTCGAASGLAPTFTVSKDQTTNSAFIRQNADQDTTMVSGGLSYRRRALGTVTAFARQSKTDYTNRDNLANAALINSGLGGFETRAAGITYLRALTSRISATASVAQTSAKSDGPGGKAFDGTTYGATLSASPTTRWTIQLNLDRDVKPSNRALGTFTVSTNYGGSVGYKLGSRIRITAGGSSSRLNFQGNSVLLSPDLAGEQTRRYFANLAFTQSERLVISLNARHQQRDAKSDLLDYQGTVVELTANLKF